MLPLEETQDNLERHGNSRIIASNSHPLIEWIYEQKYLFIIVVMTYLLLD